jgi:hypothetical protein
MKLNNISAPPIIVLYISNIAKVGKTDSGDELHNVASSAACYQYMGIMSYLFLKCTFPLYLTSY